MFHLDIQNFHCNIHINIFCGVGVGGLYEDCNRLIACKTKKKNNSISRTNDNVIINIGVKQIDAEFPMIWIALNVNKKISRGYTQ